MEEQKFDGTDKLTDNARLEDVFKALDDKVNKMVALHKPGSVIKSKDGKFYRVDKNGAWIKFDDDEIIKALEKQIK